jgi:hypothetical protein
LRPGGRRKRSRRDGELDRPESRRLLGPLFASGSRIGVSRGSCARGALPFVDQPGEGQLLFFLDETLAMGGRAELAVGELSKQCQTFPAE